MFGCFERCLWNISDDSGAVRDRIIDVGSISFGHFSNYM